jgi:large subunit ribosomal protein L23
MFEVASDANKVDIRRAVEKLWNVNVLRVRTSVVRGKEKRVGRFVGRRASWKRAVVTLAPGQNIEFFEGV